MVASNQKILETISTPVSLTIAIPAFNEEHGIEKTIKTIQLAAEKANLTSYEILIINDGSSDKTGYIVSKFQENEPRVRMVCNEKNEGLGYSIKRAIKLATGDRFIIIPGDNDMPLKAILTLFNNINVADIVMLYFQNEEIRGKLRYFLSSIFRLIYVLTYDIYVMYLNGPAIYPTNELKNLHLKSDRFSLIAEINTKLLSKGLSYAEFCGVRQRGMEGSTSFSVANLLEAIKAYFTTFIELKFKNKYNIKPKRINTYN